MPSQRDSSCSDQCLACLAQTTILLWPQGPSKQNSGRACIVILSFFGSFALGEVLLAGLMEIEARFRVPSATEQVVFCCQSHRPLQVGNMDLLAAHLVALSIGATFLMWVFWVTGASFSHQPGSSVNRVSHTNKRGCLFTPEGVVVSSILHPCGQSRQCSRIHWPGFDPINVGPADGTS
jgi:hypothetical protein